MNPELTGCKYGMEGYCAQNGCLAKSQLKTDLKAMQAKKKSGETVDPKFNRGYAKDYVDRAHGPKACCQVPVEKFRPLFDQFPE